MIGGKVLIIDADSQRPFAGEWLREHQFEVNVAAPDASAVLQAEHSRPDLVLFRAPSNLDLFDTLLPASEASGSFIAVIVDSKLSPDGRKAVLALKADGFLNDSSPRDESVALIRALIRRKRLTDSLRLAAVKPASPLVASALEKGSANISAAGEMKAPFRDRSPELYRELVRRYEEGIQLVLQHRIYKINDDVFEPFRQIAKTLFLASATARDAVELHYHTLRKIAPTPESPKAQAYLEVGRTTIIGLMGDLLTYYRNAYREENLNGDLCSSDAPELSKNQIEDESKDN
jgi:DNA-binding NarL/FixJ family response regulator